MSIFSLKWFKSKKQQQLEDLQVEEQELKKHLLRKQLVENTNPVNITYTTTSSANVTIKPYQNVKLVNDILTVVLNDGSILSKPGATGADFQAVKQARSEEEIVNICSCPEVIEEKRKRDAEISRARAMQAGIQKLASYTNEFRVENNTVYFVGINRSIPQLLVEEILTLVQDCENLGWNIAEYEEYQALKRFFMWCCLNPRAEVADDLYGFLKKNSFRITKQGFFVALRNIVTISGDTQLIQFVSNAYNKVKAVWKKDPINFWVYKVEEIKEIEEEWYDDEDFDEYERETETTVTYFISNSQDKYEGELVGNLKDLYGKLPEMAENRFTDAHTRTFDIRVGRVVNMPPEECNWNRADCAHAGLHFTADEIHYVGCGDTSVLILINPMKVVGIGEHKGRCYEYLPIMTVPRSEATEILHDLDFDCLELDEDYAVRELTNLEIKAKEGFVAESTKYEFNLPHISTAEIRGIVASLDEMKWEISKRVVSVD